MNVELVDEPLWDVQKVCEQLGVSRSWVYVQVDAKRLRHLRLTPGASRSGIRFRPADIREWVANQVGGPLQ